MYYYCLSLFGAYLNTQHDCLPTQLYVILVVKALSALAYILFLSPLYMVKVTSFATS